MHKKRRETPGRGGAVGVVKCIFFALFSTIVWYLWTFSMSCWGVVKLVDKKTYKKAFVTAQLCICTVLASSVTVCGMMVQFIIYLLIDGLKVLLTMCWVDALSCIVLVLFFVFFAWPKFPSKIKMVYIFVKEIIYYVDWYRDQGFGLAQNSPGQESCTRAEGAAFLQRRPEMRVKIPSLPQLILCQCSASLKAFSFNPSIVKLYLVCEHEQKTDCYMNKVDCF